MSATQNVDNHFEQPVGGSTDNPLVLGGTIKGSGGSQNAAIADVPTAGSATAAANATAINSILAALRDTGIIAT